MESYAIIVIIFGILICLLLVVLFFINRLSYYRSRIEKAFLTVHSCLDERVILLRKMSDWLQDEVSNEEVLLKKMEKVMVDLSHVDSCNQGIVMIRESYQLLKELKQLFKVYPYFSKRREYNELINELFANQDRIVYAMDSYDKGVLDYNNYRKNSFINRLNELFHFENYNYYNL